MTLDGKVALVTGVASDTGIGRACARALTEAGARVVGVDVHAEGCDAVLAADLGATTDHDALVDAVVGRHGRLDIVVNAAGIARTHRMLETPAEIWQRVIDVNVRGLLLLSAAAARRMAGQDGGAIVHIGSTGQDPAGLGWARSGILGPYAAYQTSKSAVAGTIPVAATELGPVGIRVNAVGPGAIVTNVLSHLGPEREAEQRLGMDGVPAGRLGVSDDVAPVVRFLASDEAAFVTGTTFMVDGGLGANRGPIPLRQRPGSLPPPARRAVVIGGGTACGSAVARALGSAGVEVVDTEPAAEAIAGSGADLLVLALPASRSGPLLELDAGRWDAAWESGAGAAWRCLSAFAEAAPTGGRIVVVVPQLGNDDVGIAASRSAVRAMVHSMADEVLARGLLVNAIEAGAATTEVLAGPGEDGDEELARAVVALTAGPHGHLTGLTIP